MATRSGISPGLGKICRGALDVVDGNECKGATSSDPGLNNLAVSYTKTGPCVRPTTILLSKEAKQIMFGVAGAKRSVLWGLKTSSAVSGVASLKAARRSANGENTRASGKVRYDHSIAAIRTYIYQNPSFVWQQQTIPLCWLLQRVGLCPVKTPDPAVQEKV